jgi:hypothetical protein
LLHNASRAADKSTGRLLRTTTRLSPYGQAAKVQNRLEGVAAYYERIDACHELIVAVGFAAAPKAESQDRRSAAQ